MAISSEKRMIKLLLLLACILGLATSIAQADEGKAEFAEFLKDSLSNEEIDGETRSGLSSRTGDFWRRNREEYLRDPDGFKQIMPLYYKLKEKLRDDRGIKIDRFEHAIDSFRRFDARNTLAKNSILFAGSSSIALWETARSFPDLPVINRGFGGASLPEIIHYYDDIIGKHRPSILVVYCDIDIEQGRAPDVAVGALKVLVNKVQNDFPSTDILLLAMKPTLVDDFLGLDVRKNKGLANQMMATYCSSGAKLHFVDVASPMLSEDGRVREGLFVADGMHLNYLGYQLWNKIVGTEIGHIYNRR